MNYGVDLLTEMIFALNKKYLPPPKWRMFYSYRLEWLPEGYRELIAEYERKELVVKRHQQKI
jgi:hypothetical protein